MKIEIRAKTLRCLLLACSASMPLSGVSAAEPPDFESLPDGVEITSWLAYDGISDDLLTAGLGASGLAGAAPGFADPLAPTAAELRRLAIYNNYRALVDMTSGGGYGRLYGPNISADGVDTGGEGLIAGIEVIARANAAGRETGDDAGEGNGVRANVTLMVQVPDSFDPANACIVTGPSSGSRGVYGAIATSGEWGLKNGCAVAYTDKGTGTGAHNLAEDTVGLIDGTRADATSAGNETTFTARLSDIQRDNYNAMHPDRVAFKHAHSQINPEKYWGENVLTSIEFAFHMLNTIYPDADLTADNTVVIASSVSNGGGSSVLAAEKDAYGLIDAVVVSEPNVNPVFEDGFVIQQGADAPVSDHSRSLFDYTTLLNLYLPCAAASPTLGAPFNFRPSPDRCASLADLGLLSGVTLDDRAAEAQAIINAAGFLEEQNILAPSHWAIDVPQAIGATYANAYGRFSVAENICGFSFAAVDGAGAIVPLGEATEAALFSTSNGIPPTGGVGLVTELSLGGPVRHDLALSPLTGRFDQNIDGALCLRALATGLDPVTGAALKGEQRSRHRRILHGVSEIRASGDLRGKPAIFVTGRSDAILPPNHTSRAYFGLNKWREGGASGLSYVEVTNAQHLDLLNGFTAFGFGDLYIPLHHYFIQGLDLMLAHLRDGAPLPPSQVVRTTTRQRDGGGTLLPVTIVDNLPPIELVPVGDALITFSGGLVMIPE